VTHGHTQHLAEHRVHAHHLGCHVNHHIARQDQNPSARLDYTYRRPPDVRTDGRAPSLEAAKADFEANWRQWLAWAKLGEVQDRLPGPLGDLETPPMVIRYRRDRSHITPPPAGSGSGSCSPGARRCA
jgi:hypothetical protein